MATSKLSLKLASALLMAGAAACTPTELTAAGTQVKVGRVPPHAGCQELDIVMGSGGGGEYSDSEHKMTSAQNDIRNKTALQGGDFVVLDASASDMKGVTLTGRAFDCSKGPPPQAPLPVIVQSSGGEAAAPAAPPPAPAAAAAPTIEERLQKLDELHKKGLITDEERAKRRGEILQSI